MAVLHRLFVVGCALLAGACGIERAGLGALQADAGEPQDADSSADAPIVRLDAGFDGGVDRDDGGDAGVECALDGPRCEGELLVVCSGGVREVTDCAAEEAFCDAETHECVGRLCVPGERSCSEDGVRVVQCDSRGSAQSTTDCEAGCDPGTLACRPVTACALAFDDLTPGVMSFDLCGQGDDSTLVTTADCSSTTAGEDRLFRFVLDERRTVLLELLDDAAAQAVDTVLYLRSACDEPDSQIVCHDDHEGEPRHSRIETTLEPGTYFLIADQMSYRNGPQRFECGRVALRYEWL